MTDLKLTPAELLCTRTVDGETWLAGIGNSTNPDIVFVACNPSEDEVQNKLPFAGRKLGVLNKSLSTNGLDTQRCYMTYAVKHSTYKGKKPSAGELRDFRPYLKAELEYLKPKVIVPMGTQALKALLTKGYTLSDFKGAPIESEEYPYATIVPIWDPGYLYVNPQCQSEFDADLAKIFGLADGQAISVRADVQYEVVTSDERAAEIFKKLAMNPPEIIMADNETCGLSWLDFYDNGGYVRTMQLGCSVEENYVFKFYPAQTEEFRVDRAVHYEGCCNIANVMNMFQGFLEFTKCPIGGQNLRFDGHWLLNYGVDVRPYFAYDTLLAEHLIDNTRLRSLTELTLRYTSLGKYDCELMQWKKEHPKLISEELGYSMIPDEILFPYAAADVVAPQLIMQQQIPHLGPYVSPRGHKGQYPSLLRCVLQTEVDLYEVEREGMPIDTEDRLPKVIKAYNDKRREMEAALLQAISQVTGEQEFNLRSTPQMQRLLYNSPAEGGLGLTPVKSTGKGQLCKPWEWVMKQTPEVQKNFNPSADGETLQLLEEKHPIVRQLLAFRRIDQICKFLPESDDSGIPGNIWSDGKIHPVFQQTTDTGRFKSEKPNCQNWTKAAESFLVEIYGGREKVPESMRSVVKPPDGWMLIEGDYKQAELFVLAYLSGDEVMIQTLTTPGMDMHTKTAIDSFGLKRLYQDGTPVIEAEILALAARDLKEFEELEKTFRYVTPDGKNLSHGEFKNSTRVAAKSINFGIPYGRGAAAIATKIEADTGVPTPVQEIQVGLDGWKQTYAKAWAYMVQCHRDVVEQGYVESPWGRRRYFHEKPEEWMVAANQREGGNFPIQSTIADTMRLAMTRVLRRRNELGLRFKCVNQIHDALILMAPVEEKQATIDALTWGMSGIHIPMPNGSSLELGVDIDLYERWGEKMKEAA